MAAAPAAPGAPRKELRPELLDALAHDASLLVKNVLPGVRVCPHAGALLEAMEDLQEACATMTCEGMHGVASLSKYGAARRRVDAALTTTKAWVDAFANAEFPETSRMLAMLKDVFDIVEQVCLVFRGFDADPTRISLCDANACLTASHASATRQPRSQPERYATRRVTRSMTRANAQRDRS